MHYFNNIVYYGEWKKGKKSGFGITNYNRDLSTYAGFYENNKKEGFGVFIWRRLQQAYCGFWKNGVENGPAVFYSKGANSYCIFTKGKITKKLRNSDIIYNILTKEQKHFWLLMVKLNTYEDYEVFTKFNAYEFNNLLII